ncbi:MAG TPA: helix-turn-helix transcriptional regulator [Acidimicrobiales bacterium]|jgi:transcriptional regulator with XRE-family HTH domain
MAGATEAAAVGERLRAVRRLRQLSLEEVERRSGGRWSASAVGAYERGFRNMTVERLRELAEFYDVPLGALLGSEDVLVLPSTDVPSRVVLDLDALSAEPEAAAVLRFARSIAEERGRPDSLLAIRAGDVRTLCVLLQMDEAALLSRLRSWGALAGRR